MRVDDYPEVPGTLAVAITLWAGAVAAGTRAGIFLKLPPEAYAALVAFAIAFAVGVVMVDARVRGWLERRGAGCASAALLGIAGIMVASGVALAGAPSPGARMAGLAGAPWAPILLFGVPATLALGLAALRALRREAGVFRRPASTGPAPLPAGPSGFRTTAASAGVARARAAG
jgi:hypothetical protein